jgi:hypothetical protein
MRSSVGDAIPTGGAALHSVLRVGFFLGAGFAALVWVDVLAMGNVLSALPGPDETLSILLSPATGHPFLWLSVLTDVIATFLAALPLLA